MMTTQRISTNRHDKQQDISPGTSGTALPQGSQPGSPTLTNPDMILPDYNDLVGYNDLPKARQTMWNSGLAIEDGFQFHDTGFYVNPDPLSTPIIYGNGTMLSDIGEVTEVESNAGTILSRKISRGTTRSSDDEARRSKTPTRNKNRFVRRDRRYSSDSLNMAGSLERTAFADFDDSISLGGDSFCQGDDEGSIASHVEDMSDNRSLQSAGETSIRRSSDEASANSMSKRAEEILANAKQRLTDMEDNLSRARTLSYSTAPEGSTSSGSSLGRTASTSYRGSPASPADPIHNRKMSENGLANSKSRSSLPQRSASALGSAGGYRRIPPASKGMEALRYTAVEGGAYTLANGQVDTSLEPLGPLGEDDFTESITGRMGGSGHTGYGTGAFFDIGLARSSVQVRDLQDQMNGLKGKISSLREQARVDSLKRRSLQSLRDPSPFNHAAWDSGHTDPRHPQLSGPHSDPARMEERNGHVDGEMPHEKQPPPPQRQQQQQQDKEQWQGQQARVEKADTASHIDRRRSASGRMDQSLRKQEALVFCEQEIRDDDDDDNGSCHSGVPLGSSGKDQMMTNAVPAQDYESESESLYHETFQHQVSHEDREDAFDYEHFFLHSAIGNIRSRSESVDSEDSVETARGPPAPAPRRRPSVDTTISVESFQTATEGRSSRSSTAQGCRVYTPADLFETDRPDSGASFHGSSSGSDSNATLNQATGRRRRQNTVLQRPSSIVSVSTRPSCSSFESTGTNRSFPLISKSRRHSGMLTPGSSPDHGARQVSKTVAAKEAVCVQEKEDSSKGHSPAMQLLSAGDRTTVEGLVAGLGQCILVLGEASGIETGAQAVYRRRIEAARQILEGKMEIP